MGPWPEQLLQLVLLFCMTVAAGAAAMILHGVLLYHRLRSSHPWTDCVTRQAGLLALASCTVTAVLLTQAEEVPWDWLGVLALLVTTAPAVLTWLGPPDEHVERSELCQIGKGSAYSHHFGYLRLMQGKHGVRERLQAFERSNEAGLSPEDRKEFYSKAVVVLAPKNGEYCSKWDELKGVGSKVGEVPPFVFDVGGNKRSYAMFKVHEVTSSENNRRMLVALDKVGALETLRSLHEHHPANLSKDDCESQMKEMMDELEKIVARNNYLRGQLKIVKYDPEEHVGDAIMVALEG